MKRNLFQPPPPREAELEARKKAIECALDEFGTYLLGYFIRRTHDRMLAEDLAQNVWINLFQTTSPELIGEIAIILRKAKQVLVDHYRKANLRAFVAFTANVPEQAASFEEMAERTASEAEAKERFWELFPKIQATEAQKEAFWLHYHQGRTLEEISAILKKPVSTVHDWIEKVRAECGRTYEEL